MATKNSISLVRILGLVIGAIGVLMMVLGVVIYSIASAELGGQRISVAALDAGNPGPHAGQTVRGPITALAQIKAISHHMGEASQTATGGVKDPDTGAVTGGDAEVTYGTAPTLSLDAQGNCLTTTKLWTDPAGAGTIQCTAGQAPDVTGGINPAALAGLRSTLTTGSFLISSLFVSVLAFGVSALIVGLGIVFLLASVGLLTVNRRAQIVTE